MIAFWAYCCAPSLWLELTTKMNYGLAKMLYLEKQYTSYVCLERYLIILLMIKCIMTYKMMHIETKFVFFRTRSSHMLKILCQLNLAVYLHSIMLTFSKITQVVTTSVIWKYKDISRLTRAILTREMIFLMIFVAFQWSIVP